MIGKILLLYGVAVPLMKTSDPIAATPFAWATFLLSE
jgi:hypothetical protein